MIALIEFAKDHLYPSSPLTAVLLLGAGVVWLWLRPAGRGARLYLSAVLLMYVILTTPLGADALVAGIAPRTPRIESPAAAEGADTVVVLGGGASTFTFGTRSASTLTVASIARGLEGARVFAAIAAKRAIVSGGIPRPDRQRVPESAILKALLVSNGVPARAIVEESTSRTTREQADRILPILRDSDTTRIVLVTSPTHMRRALMLFRAAGVQAIPSMAPTRSDGIVDPWRFLPNSDSLMLSDLALYDYAALAYYWLRGWGGPTRQPAS